MLYIGIDNGSTGGIAAIEGNGRIYFVDPMPITDADLLARLQALAEAGNVSFGIFAMLEHAHSFPKQGHVGAFNYGRGYGAMQMALHAAGIPFDTVAPSKWQTVMQCLTRGDKNVTKRRAQQLFPDVKVTHAIADALLIAEYCRRLKAGTHGQEEGRQEEGRQAVSGDGRRIGHNRLVARGGAITVERS